MPNQEPNIPEFQTMHTFSSLIEAQVLQSMMAAEGIECFIRDEQTMGVLPMYENIISGIRLDVRTTQWENALKVQTEFERTKAIKLAEQEVELQGWLIDGGFCPECDSTKTYKQKAKFWVYLKMVLILPILFHKRDYYCNSCDHSWQE